MTTSVDSSWRSLLKIGGLGLLLAGALSILNAVTSATIYSQRVSYNPKTLGDLLTFALSRTNLYYLQYYSGGAAMLLILPGVMALYFVLNQKDKGFALIGSALGILGVVIYLSNLADHLFFVQEVQIYSGGCVSCSTEALFGAAGTFSSGTADILGGFVLGAAIGVLSLLIFTGHAFPRWIGAFGLLAGLVAAVVYPVIALTGGGDLFFYTGVLSTILAALWFLFAGVGLYRVTS